MLKIYFKLKSLNSERKVNELMKNGVDVFDVQRNGKELSFFVDKKNEQKVYEFFKNEELYSYSQGTQSFLSFLKQRVGIVIGCGVFLLLLILFSNLLINIQVQGNNLVQTNQIIDILEQNGYNKFNLISKIDVKDAENCLINSLPEVAFASVMVKGNTLVVSIRENVEANNENFSPLYAEFSGVVSSINVSVGTPLVAVGDVVKKGQILIEPYEIISGNQVSVTPKAEIKAKVFVKGQVQYDENKKILGRTGAFFEERRIEFLGIDVACTSKGEMSIKANKHEVEVSEELVNGLVKMKIIKTKYFELAEITEPDFERDKSILERESVYLAYDQIKSNFEIKNQSTHIIKIENVYYVTTYLEIEKNIAIQNEIK